MASDYFDLQQSLQQSLHLSPQHFLHLSFPPQEQDAAALAGAFVAQQSLLQPLHLSPQHFWHLAFPPQVHEAAAFVNAGPVQAVPKKGSASMPRTMESMRVRLGFMREV